MAMKSLIVLSLVAGSLVSGCGGGGGGGGINNRQFSSGTCATTSSPSNQLPICVDAGPSPSTAPVINIPYVSVTVCYPNGMTNNCQTIDHIQLDTGSSGLRVLASALTSVSLPAVTSGGNPLGTCTQFADGYTWGSVRTADIHLSGEVALDSSIQVIDDNPNGQTVPTDCKNTGGTPAHSVADLGAKGILGVGVMQTDSGVYYVCATATGCTATMVTTAQVIPNPVAKFTSGHNQGVVVTLPAVADAGATNLSGMLQFGFPTKIDHTPNVSGVTTLFTDGFGDIKTTYTDSSGMTMTYASFIDSGSNGIFFPDALIPCQPTPSQSTVPFFCPSSTLNLTATNFSSQYIPASGSVSFSIVNINKLSSSVNAANVGAYGVAMTLQGNSTLYFDWGLPFFFGRSVYTAMEDNPALGSAYFGGAGPYFAY